MRIGFREESNGGTEFSSSTCSTNPVNQYMYTINGEEYSPVRVSFYVVRHLPIENKS